MPALIPGLLAGLVVTAVGGALHGFAYHHVVVPFNDAMRAQWRAGLHRSANRHGQLLTRVFPGTTPCCARVGRWRRRTVLEYQGADRRSRQFAVPGVYPLGAEMVVRVAYRGNRPYPLTLVTGVRGAITGAVVGIALGLDLYRLLCAAVSL